ncbi:MAG: T9SS type A sorting domain-containing protein [Salibacteraceae bacterium]
MKKQVIFYFLTLVSLCGVGQDTVFHYFVGTSGIETSVAIFENGGYVDVFGSTGGAGSGQSDIYCVRMSSTFEPFDFVTIGSQGIEKLEAVIMLDELEGYAILYTAYDGFGDKGYYARLEKLDSSLLPQQSVPIYGEANHIPVDIATDGDNIFTLTEIETSGMYTYKVSIFDLNLDLGHEFIISKVDSMVLESIFINDEIIVVGTHKFADSSYSDVLILKYSLDGELLQESSFGTEHNDIGSSVISVADTAYLVTGSTNGYLGEDFDVYLVKLDTSLNIIWEQIHGHNPFVDNKDEFGVNSLVGFDGKIYVGLTSSTYGEGKEDFHVYQLNDSGQYEIGNSFGLESTELMSEIVQFSDSTYTMIGSTNSIGVFGLKDIFVVSTRVIHSGPPKVYTSVKDTISRMNVTGVSKHEEVNPLAEIIQKGAVVELNSNVKSYLNGQLYDLSGHLISSFQFSDIYNLDMNNLPSGLYVLVLNSFVEEPQVFRFIRY